MHVMWDKLTYVILLMVYANKFNNTILCFARYVLDPREVHLVLLRTSVILVGTRKKCYTPFSPVLVANLVHDNLLMYG